MPTAIDHLTRFVMLKRGFRADRIDTGRGEVHALVHEGGGELPPLTVLHGWSSMGAHQFLVVRGLRHRLRRTVLPDLPGHGWSSGPRPLTPADVEHAVREAFPRWHPEPAVWMGSSFGGYVAVKYALAHPEQVRSLILVSPAGGPTTPEEREEFLRLLRGRTDDDVRRFLDRVSGRPRKRNWLFAPQMRRILNRRPLQDLLDHEEGLPSLTPADLDRLRVPVTLVWGRRENLLPRHHLDFWRRIRDVEVHEPEHSGHSPSIDEPDRFRAIVEDHLRRVA